MKHQLPPLPYAHDALEPVISAQTLQLHHGKHHAGYVDKLNDLIAGTKFEDMDLMQILQESDGPLYNSAAQHFNHSLYWRTMRPGGSGEPIGSVASAIERSFGSVEKLREEFLAAAIGQFGSGWAWLVLEADGFLAIEATSNAQVPIGGGRRPILTCDVWEHAYYLDYQNRRPEHVEKWWGLIDWEQVEAFAKDESLQVTA